MNAPKGTEYQDKLRTLNYQYLESLDSVRSPWHKTENISTEEERVRELYELEVLLEVLLSLSLGRQIIVPQSYAFDSWGFLRAAETVFHARDLAGFEARIDHPFLLHLYNARSYDEAAVNMLKRVRNPDDPIFSSLLPELHSLPDGEITKIINNLDFLCQSNWIGDERATALTNVREEFSRSPTISAYPRSNPVKLAELVNSITDDSSHMTRGSQIFSEQARQVYTELGNTIRKLDPGRSGIFSQRSLLRVSKPWPGNAEGCPAEEIVGREKLNLLIEFIDTLYNIVVADSIGLIPMALSTDLTLEDDQVSIREVAQKIACADYAATTEGLTVSVPYDREGSVFEAWLGSNQPSIERVNDIRECLKSDLVALFGERANKKRRGCRRSKFWLSLDKLKRALIDGNEVAARRALETHIENVSNILGRGVDIELSDSRGESASRWWVQLFIQGTIGAGGAILATETQMPILPVMLIGGLTTVAPEFTERSMISAQRWRRTAMHRKALGMLLEIRKIGG